MIILITLFLASGQTVMAATQAEINASTTAGVAWLVAQQQANGSWLGGYAADTGFALGALEHYAEKLGKTPLDPTYIYYTNVQDGLNYLFSSATYDATNSWVYWNVGGNNSYQTGPCIMGIARSGAPTAIVSGGALDGFTYLQVAQMAVDWLGSAQITSGDGTGAWYYTKGSTTGDQSAAGWVTLGLGYAAHSMGCTLPAGLLTRLATWNEFIQCHTAGPDFGGAAYTSSYIGWYNVYKTGHLLFAHGLCGSTVATARVQDALTFMDAHWADLTNGAGSTNDYGWRGNPPGTLPSYIAIAAAAKGFTELEIETFNGHDWYNDFADVCVANQWPDGHWLGGGHGETNNRSTCWALLGLLRATSHFPPMVTTSAADNLGSTIATLNGSLTDMGTAATVNLSFQYGTTSGSLTSETTPVTYSSTLPYAFSANISGLTMGATYYFRAKAVGDATGYGDELSFVTLPVPTVTTTAVTAITNTSATSGGNVTADNGSPVTARGVCWSTSANPTIADKHTTDGTGTGSFVSFINSLASATVYHVRAYATNTAGTAYGNDIVFTTASINQYRVIFLHNANGHLSGSQTQIIEQGQNCSPVTAIPDLGYRFQGWSGDYVGSENPLTIRNVTDNMTINAVFVNDPPKVVITSPLDGSQVYGVVTVKADVSDDTRIAGVEFYMDGKLQEHIIVAQNDGQQILAVSGANRIKEAGSNSTLASPDRILQKGIWQFDLRDAQAIFLSAEMKARKVDSTGRISAVIHPDVDIAQLQLLPQINSLAVAFSYPQILEDGKYYTIVLADFNNGTLTGLEVAPALLAGNFQTSQAFQTDALHNLYYLIYNAEQGLLLRTWNPARGPFTLFGSGRPILEWQVAPEGAILLQSVPAAKDLSAIRIWYPRLGWIGENQSLLSGQAIQQWSRTAVSLSPAPGNHLETYFPQSAEIFHSRFDDIQAVSLLDNLILIAGSQADVSRVELLDRDRNTNVVVPTGSLEVRKTSWISTRLVLLAGYDQAAKKYILARLQLRPEEPPTITYLGELPGMPLQIQNTRFNESTGVLPGNSDPGPRENKWLKNIPPDIAFPSSGVNSLNVSAQFSFTWNTINSSVANHVLKVVAYDDANASGADEIIVIVVKVKLDLLAERKEARAFSILRQYGQIQFLVEDFGIPVAQYRIMRRKGAADFELLKTITPAELQNHQFQMQDKYLEKGTPYTYLVEAFNAAGELLGISAEKTI